MRLAKIGYLPMLALCSPSMTGALPFLEPHCPLMHLTKPPHALHQRRGPISSPPPPSRPNCLASPIPPHATFPHLYLEAPHPRSLSSVPTLPHLLPPLLHAHRHRPSPPPLPPRLLHRSATCRAQSPISPYPVVSRRGRAERFYAYDPLPSRLYLSRPFHQRREEQGSARVRPHDDRDLVYTAVVLHYPRRPRAAAGELEGVEQAHVLAAVSG